MAYALIAFTGSIGADSNAIKMRYRLQRALDSDFLYVRINLELASSTRKVSSKDNELCSVLICSWMNPGCNGWEKWCNVDLPFLAWRL